MKVFLKPKLIFPLVMVVMRASALAVPLLFGSASHSQAAGNSGNARGAEGSW